MTVAFADTALFVAALAERDAHHTRALQYFREFEGRIVTTQWILVELGNFFAGSTSRTTIASFIDELEDDFRFTVLSASAADYQAGLSLYSRRPDKQWSLTDCISMEIMRRERIAHVLTTDHHFEQAGFEILLK